MRAGIIWGDLERVAEFLHGVRDVAFSLIFLAERAVVKGVVRFERDGLAEFFKRAVGIALLLVHQAEIIVSVGEVGLEAERHLELGIRACVVLLEPVG